MQKAPPLHAFVIGLRKGAWWRAGPYFEEIYLGPLNRFTTLENRFYDRCFYFMFPHAYFQEDLDHPHWKVLQRLGDSWEQLSWKTDFHCSVKLCCNLFRKNPASEWLVSGTSGDQRKDEKNKQTKKKHRRFLRRREKEVISPWCCCCCHGFGQGNHLHVHTHLQTPKILSDQFDGVGCVSVKPTLKVPRVIQRVSCPCAVCLLCDVATIALLPHYHHISGVGFIARVWLS